MHVFTTSLVLLIGVCLHAMQVMTASEASDPWIERLEQLDPSRPLEYFALGEEIADVAEAHSAEQRLALELFALAGQLDFHSQDGLEYLWWDLLSADAHAGDAGKEFLVGVNPAAYISQGSH